MYIYIKNIREIFLIFFYITNNIKTAFIILFNALISARQEFLMQII